MKVVHIISGLNDGGAEAVLYRLCSSDMSVQHHVVSLMDEGKYGALLQDAGVQVFCLNMPQGRVTASGLWKLWQLLRRIRPRVVQTWMYHADFIGGIVAKLAGIKAVFWGIHHSNLSSGTVKRSTILTAKICAKLSSIVPVHIISCSEQAALAHQQLGYCANKFSVIANGYDLQIFNPDKDTGLYLRHALGIKSGIALLGMVARFDQQKDHANLIAALSILKKQNINFYCLLVGSGMDATNNELVELLHQFDASDNVRLLGRRDDIPAVMNALDVHVLSSLGEAFPNVLAEAMACAIPCVTTNVGDSALIVGETGWIVPPSDSVKLANALNESIAALADPKSWAARKQQARERIIKNFSLAKMVDAYQTLWLGGQ